MQYGYYTLAFWRVKPGRERDFIEAWAGLGAAFATLPSPPVFKGTLVQNVSDPSLFYSFGPWKSLEDIQTMRATPAAQAAIQRVVALCDEANPGAYRVVKEIELEA
jgi:heme-degrading monooxygenase HmoA